MPAPARRPVRLNLFAHAVFEAVTIGLLGEVAVAELKVAATKRVAAVHATLGARHRQRADVHALDLELMRRQARIEQGHGDRIRFFAGRARQAENAQCAHVVQLGETLAREFAECGEGFRITEKPGFGNDYRLNQCLLLVP